MSHFAIQIDVLHWGLAAMGIGLKYSFKPPKHDKKLISSLFVALIARIQ